MKVAVRAVLLAVFSLATIQASTAATILKLSLGNDSAADLRFSGGVLSTIDDGVGGPLSPGNQNTAVEFLDFLSSNTNIPADASFTMSGITAAVQAFEVVGVPSTVVQDFSGGTFSLYDTNGSLLLAVNLGNSRLSGNVGSPANGGVFSTTFGSPLPGALGGTLGPSIQPNSVTLSITLADINNGGGLTFTPILNPFPGFFLGTLGDFDANVTQSIDAQQVPEPTVISLVLAGVFAAFAARRRIG